MLALKISCMYLCQLKEALERSERKLAELQNQFDHKIKPANFADYVDFRLQLMRSGQRGCCAFFPSGSGKANSAEPSDGAEESVENTPTMK